jgi:diketogulonate reductase-like aldo/keto reductase
MQTVVANGARIPVVGFGTYGMSRPDMLRMIPTALKAGFRHIDTAQIYDNEVEVGECIAASGIPRSEIFVTTKVWVSNYPKRRFVASVDESLQKLKSDYIDLLLLHWPNDAVSLPEQIDNLNAVARTGKVRYIGVSNFNSDLMSRATHLSTLPLVTNQLEYHPYLNQSAVIGNTRLAGMAVTAYCGMAIGRVFTDPTLAGIAARHNKGIAQVVLRWLVQQDGVVALSRTVNPKRVVENVAIFDFELDQDEMQAIHGLARSDSRIVSPPGLAPQWD